MTVKQNVVLDFDPLAPLCENMTSFTKLEAYKYCTVVKERPGKRKFHEFGTCGF